MVTAVRGDPAAQRRAMEREARTAMHRAETIADAAARLHDPKAVELAEGVAEAVWHLLRNLSRNPDLGARR